ncbi:MAG: hypothetical protein ABS85_03650 [Sphingobacteriales bacterium SCN 48-20]|uniref:glycosyltransferase family 4 protein n=1 Tax=Terrimonas ferruginea TaxID=249 RepID=UPI00086E9A4C|nr:glycosyltransferase family 4 protein [Terrimonas ferruginea]MBN8784009.1 glycosyltransferase family 4 protein [Terrimonas ferruginea]ODT94168.1 MAG: hypothetical protein ABS85_03650 [Sphingobacteriales bacterium SCN 48-20]OJW41686.1 MAG: hypothetical protein BGO56_17675 [Sphingobacteriales bacterium 48-107]
MIRVASLVSYKVMPAKMGGQKAVYLLLKYLAGKVSVVCYTTSNNEPAPDEPFEVQKVFPDHPVRYANPFAFFKLRKKMRQQQATHLMIDHPYMGWLALALRRALRIPLVVRSHNIEALRFRSVGKWWWRLLWSYEKYVHRHADLNLFITAGDRDYAIRHYGLSAGKCVVITYGIEKSIAPTKEEKQVAKSALLRQYQLPAETSILLFNGTLNYPPNLQALDILINEVAPALQANAPHCCIMVCGSRLPEKYAAVLAQTSGIVYTGFVPDIEPYYLAADFFLNPVSEGGGIKTKLVEALAADLTTISFASGATGIPADTSGQKLHVVEDGNVRSFITELLKVVHQQQPHIPTLFFKHFYWGNIAEKTAVALEVVTG